jgi:NAD(P)-dependent dehydrogenase (short-subunit alcohol dehydrogenase family)
MQTVVITGGTGGLGTTVVARLARDYHVVVLYRSTPPTDVAGVRADLMDEQSVRDAFAEVGEIYALVHLAGGFAAGAVASTSLETWTEMLALNTTAAFLAIREALPRLTRPGRIVAVSSIASVERGTGTAAYTVSKSALNTLIETAAREQKENGITVNAVLPDSMATPAMLAEIDAAKLVPLDRVAETIAFLLSEAAASINGALLPLRR